MKSQRKIIVLRPKLKSIVFRVQHSREVLLSSASSRVDATENSQLLAERLHPMQLVWLLILPLAPSVLSQTTNDTLLWGAYRPNLYFGLRPRIPQSLMTGLMWYGTQDYQSIGSECTSSLAFPVVGLYAFQRHDTLVTKGTNSTAIHGRNMIPEKEAFRS